MNHNRGGAQQHRIMKGSMNYFPNRNNVGHPVPSSEGGYVEYVTQKYRGVFLTHKVFFAGTKKRLLGLSSVYGAPSSKSTLIKRNYSTTPSLRTKRLICSPLSLSSSVTVMTHKSTRRTPSY